MECQRNLNIGLAFSGDNMKNLFHRFSHTPLLPCSIGALLLYAFATSWAPVKKECPICGTKGIYYDISSYGSYIYDYPTKYEYIFWPYTDGKSLYTCKKCWFTSFIEDFKEVPQDKHKDIRKFLDSLALWETSGDYNVIPMSYRLIVAEHIYQIIGKDDEFWCHFYRVMGYHCADEGKTEQAALARTKALKVAERMLFNMENIGLNKELYIITGAMKYLLNDKLGALRDFKQAQKLTYEKAGLDKESLENMNLYLSYLINGYIAKIEKKEEERVIVSATPTIADLVKSPELFVNSMITVTGLLVNQGTGYLKDFRPAIKDKQGNAVRVLAWAPLQMPESVNPNIFRIEIMSDFLDRKIEASGYFRKDDKNLFDRDYYIEIINAQIISK